MDSITLKPRAKINVSLDVLRKLENGYHELETVMQTLKFHDDLFIKKTSGGEVKFETKGLSVPNDEGNLVLKAVKLLKNKFDTGGLYIELFKRIPAAAGLGGGSSNAAAALRGINKLCALNLNDEEIKDLGLKIGADVPFFIKGGTFLAQGIGERLSELPKHPFTHVLVCKPGFDVSTKDVYENLQIERITKRPDTGKIIEALKLGDIRKIAANSANALEFVTEKFHPQITEIKALMKKHGAFFAQMSGSGPSVFGYFEKKQNGIAAAAALKKSELCAGGIFLTSVF
ncbi:MAG: 4-(cytidine 5'-diphospho)-2-C-methyl-D-erythritol kinase [Clostridiales bacterium]|jgi:4-diphosphocytidyl-2-C-methyl-D-erythritol kinase|nr:4-(cytidine 5'-diphospho)-2-C-methyl-D-erythritol kinase [Clostridiales bacterium]